VLSCDIAVQLLLILLHLLFVKRLELNYRAAHDICLLRVVVDMITHLVKPYPRSTVRSYRGGIPKYKGSTVGSTQHSLTIGVSFPKCNSLNPSVARASDNLCLKLSI
jgi:hypothetical protein